MGEMANLRDEVFALLDSTWPLLDHPRQRSMQQVVHLLAQSRGTPLNCVEITNTHELCVEWAAAAGTPIMNLNHETADNEVQANSTMACQKHWYILDEPLATILGEQVLSPAKIISKIRKFAKEGNMMDYNDPTIIVPQGQLLSVLGEERCLIWNIIHRLKMGQHLAPAQCTLQCC